MKEVKNFCLERFDLPWVDQETFERALTETRVNASGEPPKYDSRRVQLD